MNRKSTHDSYAMRVLQLYTPILAWQNGGSLSDRILTGSSFQTWFLLYFLTLQNCDYCTVLHRTVLFLKFPHVGHGGKLSPHALGSWLWNSVHSVLWSVSSPWHLRSANFVATCLLNRLGGPRIRSIFPWGEQWFHLPLNRFCSLEEGFLSAS